MRHGVDELRSEFDAQNLLEHRRRGDTMHFIHSRLLLRYAIRVPPRWIAKKCVAMRVEVPPELLLDHARVNFRVRKEILQSPSP